MKLAMIGLGKMGANMVRRLRRDQHTVFAFDQQIETAERLATECGSIAVRELESFKNCFSGRKAIWVMVPAGDPTTSVIESLRKLLSSGDVIIDGGNSNFKDTIARADQLKRDGLLFVDAGTSGGVWGLEVGYCLMVGGEKQAIEHIEPALKTLAPENGYLHVGPSGSGHYVKMIHNGIEYGLMQAYAEGFDILEHSRFDLDLGKIAKLWNRGSVIRSWLLELSENIFDDDPKLEQLKGFVQDSGEGRWTVQEAIDLSVPAPVITDSLLARFRSRRENTFSDRYLAALRNQFGGHAVQKK